MVISIVIPTWNNKELLKNSLEALNDQIDFEHEYEVVVVDDGSTDDTLDYVTGVNRTYSLEYVYLERCAQSCRARTRNTGWKKARGEIIAFLDSDIVVAKDYVKELYRYFSVSQDIVLIGNRLMLNEPVSYDSIANGAIFDMFSFNKERYDIMEYRHFVFEKYSYNGHALWLPWVFLYSCNVAVAKKWIEAIGGFEERMINWGMEDVEFGCSLVKNGLSIVVNPKLEVLHQYHGERNDLIISQKNIPGYEKNIDIFLEKHSDVLPMRKKHAYKFFKGEINMDKFNFFPKNDETVVIYDGTTSLNAFYMQVEQYVQDTEDDIVIIDSDETKNIDLWVQVQSTFGKRIKYFPASKRINLSEIIGYMENEKKAQISREQCEYV